MKSREDAGSREASLTDAGAESAPDKSEHGSKDGDTAACADGVASVELNSTATKAVSAASASKKPLRKVLSQGQRKKFDALVARVKQLLVSASSDDALRRYGIAEQVVYFKTTFPQTKDLMKDFADQVGMDRKTLYAHGPVAQKWHRQKFEELVRRRTKKGNALDWWKFVALAHNDFDKNRDELVERVFGEEMTVRDIHALRRSERRERKATAPKQNQLTSYARATSHVAQLRDFVSGQLRAPVNDSKATEAFAREALLLGNELAALLAHLEVRAPA